jgi:hypothetical protein
MVYQESHIIKTDQFGSVSLVIGEGADKYGALELINWGGDFYFLKVEIDNTGGSVYADMGTTQLLSVPYAFYSDIAGNGFSGDYNHLFNKPVTDGSETKLSVGDDLTITGTGTTDFPYILDARKHYIGEFYGGGIVFYVYDKGRHGLIAATRDQDPGIQWYNGVKRYTNTTGDGVRAGEMNTALIIALQTNDNEVGNFAAKVCADYSVIDNGVTYGDWYLPSKHELAILFYQKDLVGGFNSNTYWSSTELSSISAWCQSFSNGTFFNLNKSSLNGVRGIRAF